LLAAEPGVNILAPVVDATSLEALHGQQPPFARRFEEQININQRKYTSGSVG
jgi:hypothetical protein